MGIDDEPDCRVGRIYKGPLSFAIAWAGKLLLLTRFSGYLLVEKVYARRMKTQWITATVSAFAAMLLGPVAAAQTARSVQDVRQTYGARLAPLGPNDVPKASNSVVRRLETRVNTRISTRIERYSLKLDPIAALQVAPADNTAALRKRVEPTRQADPTEGDPR